MTKTPHSKPTIYLADDDVDDRDLLKEAFQQITDKHHLHVFSNGKELIEFLSTKREDELPCLIVLDYNMPQLNGKEVLKYLQNTIRYRNIPKVIYSTSSYWKEKSEFLALGANEFMTKAATFDGILNAVKAMLSHCDNLIRMTA